MSMTPQEQAFHDWAESVGSFGFDYLEVWNAACKWQRERDAELVRNKWGGGYFAQLISGELNEYDTNRF